VVKVDELMDGYTALTFFPEERAPQSGIDTPRAVGH
jgi:hypothetical protein